MASVAALAANDANKMRSLELLSDIASCVQQLAENSLVRTSLCPFQISVCPLSTKKALNRVHGFF